LAKLAVRFQTTFALKQSSSVQSYSYSLVQGFQTDFVGKAQRYGMALRRYCLAARVRWLNLPPSFPRRRESRPWYFGHISRLLQILTYGFLRIFLASVGMGITAMGEQGGRLR